MQKYLPQHCPGVTGPVVYKGQSFRGLLAVDDPELRTKRYRSREGILPGGASVVLPMMHGMGPLSSHAGSMLATLNALTGSKRKPGRSDTLRAIRQLPFYGLLGGEAIDLPGCHGAEVDPSVWSVQGAADWARRWIASMPTEATHVIPLARSASTAILLRLAADHPRLLNGLILLSPMLPSDRQHSNEDLLQRIDAGEAELNPSAFSWMNSLCEQSQWDELPDPFESLPTLILTGREDSQVSDRVRMKCRQWARELPHVRYFDVESAGHDVLNLRNRQPVLRALAQLYQFVHDVRESDRGSITSLR
jgi:hypothetical protein